MAYRFLRRFNEPFPHVIRNPFVVPIRSSQRSIGHIPLVTRRREFPSFTKDGAIDTIWHDQARSLLRALLRECTYLPDPTAKIYFTQFILERFRKERRKTSRLSPKHDVSSRIQGRLKLARSAALLLRRVNEGEERLLRKLLLLAYGRAGKQKHQLLAKLSPVGDQSALDSIERPGVVIEDPTYGLSQISDNASKSKPAAQDQANNGQKEPAKQDTTTEVPLRSKEEIWNKKIAQQLLSPELHALLRAHQRLKVPHYTSFKRLHPEIPLRNSWGHPQPLSRVRNMARKWVLEVVHHVYPPLPRQEWQGLRDRAMGKIIADVPKPRRKGIDEKPPSALQTVLSQQKLHLRMFGNRFACDITPRKMQRLWADTFAVCPLLHRDEMNDKLNVVWGDEVLHSWRMKPRPSTTPSNTAAEADEATVSATDKLKMAGLFPSVHPAADTTRQSAAQHESVHLT